MTTPTFIWGVAQGAAKELTPRVLSSKFGDGYEQRAGDGININQRKWSVSFISKSLAIADAIDDFLLTQDGITSFLWYPPSGLGGFWICRSWKRVADTFATWTITCMFEEVFGEGIAPPPAPPPPPPPPPGGGNILLESGDVLTLESGSGHIIQDP